MRWLLWLLVLMLSACGETERFPLLPPGTVVLALGDSLTAGAGVATEQAWPALLARRTGWQVINGGVNGDTSAQGLQRLPDLLDEFHPALVLVTLGGNDMLRHLPVSETEQNLTRAIVKCRIENAGVVLLATPQPSLAGAVLRNLSAPEFYRQVAAAQAVPLIEDVIPDVLSDPTLKGDQVHPNAQGHALIAERVYAALRDLGYAQP
ncbi:MAG: arylesterase [Pseudomonadota bacterium]